MPMFRKKPVVIEAMQYTGDAMTVYDISQWVHAGRSPAANATVVNHGTNLTVRTLEGDMTALPGDWIIKGVKGEFYPCKPDIFAATYEPADGQPIPESTVADLERSDWTPEEALRWYAAGKHFDTVGGHTRILDTGAVASIALKRSSVSYHALHGADASFPPPADGQAQHVNSKDIVITCETGSLPDADMIEWAADRMVNVYGEPVAIDFVLALRRIAAKIRAQQGADKVEALPSHKELARLLHSIGWRSSCDAQYENLRDVMPMIRNMFRKATPNQQ